jgi:hypothetical protein
VRAEGWLAGASEVAAVEEFGWSGSSMMATVGGCSVAEWGVPVSRSIWNLMLMAFQVRASTSVECSFALASRRSRVQHRSRARMQTTIAATIIG